MISDRRPQSRSDARRNRAAIIAAARRILPTDPGATIAEIAESAGVSRGTVYGHFGRRNALAETIDAVTIGDETVDPGPASHGDQRRAGLRAFVECGRNSGLFRRDQTIEWQIACIVALARLGAPGAVTGWRGEAATSIRAVLVRGPDRA